MASVLGGVPLLDFSSLSELPKVWKDARQERDEKMTLASLGKALQSGEVDYTKLAGETLANGNTKLGLQFLTLGEAQQKRAREAKAAQEFTSGISGPAPVAAPTAAPVGPQSSTGNYGDAIAKIESGGSYDLLGPVIKSGAYAGDRAVGKYQVMGKNVPVWTQEVLGRPMTPQEFAQSPEAQEAVFKAKFGQLAAKHGPEGAARAWFAGEGGMNDPGRKDQLGTTVASYGQQFTRNLGPQVASVGGMPTPDSAPAAPPAASPGVQIAQAQPPVALGVQVTPRIRQLFGAMANPDLPAAQKEIAKTLLTRELDETKLDPAIKKYLYDKAQGFTGTRMEHEQMLRKAGATNVNVGDGNSKKFDDTLDKEDAERWIEIRKTGDAARRKMVDIDTMREIHNTVGSQGAWAGVKEAIGPFAEAVGIDISNLSDIQAYGSVIERLAPQQRAPGSGSTSDVEFKGFRKSLPGLIQNPAAREVGLQTMQALTQDEIARGEIASRLITKEITRGQAEKELRALRDPMTAFKEWRKANPDAYKQALKGGSATPASPQGGSAKPAPTQQAAPVKVTTPAERDALPPGTVYIAPDGSPRVKR